MGVARLAGPGTDEVFDAVLVHPADHDDEVSGEVRVELGIAASPPNCFVQGVRDGPEPLREMVVLKRQVNRCCRAR